MTKEKEVQLHRGLSGIYLDRTKTSFIDGKKGILEYGGHSISDLARKSNFEEVAYLILYGKLPTRSQLEAFDSQLKAARTLPEQAVDIINLIKHGHPMEVLRTVVSMLSAFDPDRQDNSLEAAHRKGIRLTSQVPYIVMAHHHIRNGHDYIKPDPTLNHAANFLYMYSGVRPSENAIRLMDKDLVLHADHGLNASSFTARTVTGTKAEFYAAITAAIAALSGPSHGGAAEDVMQMAREIETPDRAEDYVKEQLAQRKRITGFGHRVYKVEDPRAQHLREEVKLLSAEMNQSEWYSILEGVQRAMAPHARRGVHVNVDFFAGVIYHLLGLSQDMFVPIFAVGRVPGWTAQIVEQMEHNILIRPLLLYHGEHELPYIPIDERPEEE